jgi:anti-sigma regulatory factor (Ser/Thr protein kinase)
MVRTQLRSLVPEGHTDRRLDDVLLLASELATNAVLHTSGSVALFGWRTRNCEWRVEVTDESPERLPPAVRQLPTAAGGRGLAIVDTLATHWGQRRIPGGKSCWFELCP